MHSAKCLALGKKPVSRSECLSNGGAATEAASAPPKDTALVLLPTGELREYPRPAMAARVLEDFSSADGWFLCDSDRMGFEGVVAAVGGAEALLLGRIYFVLLRGLRREEVAELAVKASVALAAKANSASGTGSRRRRGTAVAPLFAPTEEEDVVAEEFVDAWKAVPAAGKRRRPAAHPRRMHRRFAPDLTAIPEGELSE